MVFFLSVSHAYNRIAKKSNRNVNVKPDEHWKKTSIQVFYTILAKLSQEMYTDAIENWKKAHKQAQEENEKREKNKTKYSGRYKIKYVQNCCL